MSGSLAAAQDVSVFRTGPRPAASSRDDWTGDQAGGFESGYPQAGQLPYDEAFFCDPQLKPLPDEAGRRSAKVTIEVCTSQRPIYFTGTQALEIRPGFVSLQIPPLEYWAESLKWLTPAQQVRFEEPEFYEMLQRQIAMRLGTLPPSPPG